jgi:hypothetical protein
MQLMRPADVPIDQHDRVFRYSPVRALLVAFSIICASGGLALFGWIQQSGLAYYVAGVLFLSLAVMSKFVLARYQPSNWLVRLNDQGMFLQFRSYLNHHFPAHDLTVVFIPYHEIRSVRLVHERCRTITQILKGLVARNKKRAYYLCLNQESPSMLCTLREGSTPTT